jgi:hypothetical protein
MRIALVVAVIAAAAAAEPGLTAQRAEESSKLYFARGQDGTPLVRYYDGSAPWVPLGGTAAGNVRACVFGSTVVAALRGMNNEVFFNRRRGGEWGGWRSAGGAATSDPAVACESADVIHLLVRTDGDAVMHRVVQGDEPQGDWSRIGGEIPGSPNAAMVSATRLDVVVRGKENKIWRNQRIDGEWRGWRPLGDEPITGDPGIAHAGNGEVWLAARSPSGELLVGRVPDSGSISLQPAGGRFPGSPWIVSDAPGSITVYVRGENDHLWVAVRSYQDPARFEWREREEPQAVVHSDPSVVWTGGPRLTVAPVTDATRRARFRISLTGFQAIRTTYDDALGGNRDGWGDEVRAGVVYVHATTDGNVLMNQSLRTTVYGDSRSPIVNVPGAVGNSGGIVNGSTVPGPFLSPSRPTSDLLLPATIWEGELRDGVDVLTLVPTLWEVDYVGSEATQWRSAWTSAFDQWAERWRRAHDSWAPAHPNDLPATVEVSNRYGRAGIVTQPSHPPGERPIGIRYCTPRGSTDRVACFSPVTVMLTYRSANDAAGMNGGVVRVQYDEPQADYLDGSYVLFLKVERQ